MVGCRYCSGSTNMPAVPLRCSSAVVRVREGGGRVSRPALACTKGLLCPRWMDGSPTYLRTPENAWTVAEGGGCHHRTSSGRIAIPPRGWITIGRVWCGFSALPPALLPRTLLACRLPDGVWMDRPLPPSPFPLNIITAQQSIHFPLKVPASPPSLRKAHPTPFLPPLPSLLAPLSHCSSIFFPLPGQQREAEGGGGGDNHINSSLENACLLLVPPSLLSGGLGLERQTAGRVLRTTTTMQNFFPLKKGPLGSAHNKKKTNRDEGRNLVQER